MGQVLAGSAKKKKRIRYKVFICMSNCFSILISEVLLMDCDLITPGTMQTQNKKDNLGLRQLRFLSIELTTDRDMLVEVEQNYNTECNTQKLRHISGHCQDLR